MVLRQSQDANEVLLTCGDDTSDTAGLTTVEVDRVTPILSTERQASLTWAPKDLKIAKVTLACQP